jgi:hypothetical protein
MSRAHYRTTLYSAPCRSSRPRALMNRNSNPDAPRIILTEHGRHDPEPADGNLPLRQVLAAPGGDAGPLACGAGELECPGGVPGWAKYGAAARSPVHLRGNLKVVSFAANSRATMAIWAAGVGALSRPPLARPSGKVIHDYLRHFPEFLPLASSRRRAGWLANECGQSP